MMLLQTNSYIVPKDKRAQHARLVQRFRQCLARLGCDHFEAYEQVGANWSPADTTGRFVQLMRFRDRKHQLAVQAAERNDTAAQALIKEFVELINFPYQQQQGLFAVGFYHSLLPTLTAKTSSGPGVEEYEEEEPVEEEASEAQLQLPAEPGNPPAVPTTAHPQHERDERVAEEVEGGEVKRDELETDAELVVLAESDESLLSELDVDDTDSSMRIHPQEHGVEHDEHGSEGGR